MKVFLKNYWPFILLAVLAFTVHLAFLSYPAQVVFDEVHFGKFVAAYSTGQYYFDIHPPLGKLMIAGFVKIIGVNPVFDFQQIGESLPAGTLAAMRFLPAFFGGLLVLAFAWLAWLITRSKSAALIAGFLILLDNAFLVQSKFILVDIFMLFFEILTLCFFFLWQRQKSFNAKWFDYLLFTAIFAGLTVSVKWTGLAIIGIIGMTLLAKIFNQKLTNYLTNNFVIARSAAPRLRGGATKQSRDFTIDHGIAALPAVARKDKLKETFVGLFILILIAFIIYLIPFYLHFHLLQKSGPGDAFMSQPFQQELKYGRGNTYAPLNFWQKFTELNKTMYTANASITAEHPFGSQWYTWPFNIKPIYYWNDNSAEHLPGWQARIYFSGNPVLWLMAIAAVFILSPALLLSKKMRLKLNPIFHILLLGYFANLLPFIFIGRVAFLYHYLPSAIYANMILTLLLAKLWPKQKTVFWTAAILILLSFAILSPLSYGWLLPPAIDQISTQIITAF